MIRRRTSLPTPSAAPEPSRIDPLTERYNPLLLLFQSLAHSCAARRKIVPLFSSVCRLFCTLANPIPNPLNALPALSQKQRGWGGGGVNCIRLTARTLAALSWQPSLWLRAAGGLKGLRRRRKGSVERFTGFSKKRRNRPCPVAKDADQTACRRNSRHPTEWRPNRYGSTVRVPPARAGSVP
jgi:hypothetical protein